MSGNRIVIALVIGLVLAAAANCVQADFKPWDDLTSSPPNWIATNSVNMHAANIPGASYPVSFNAASGGKASGMSALVFEDWDSTSSHHVSRDLTGSVDVLATGNKGFSTVLVLIAVDAASLPGDFGLTLNGYTCNPAADFVYYDGMEHPLGRPSGYYPTATDPEGEQIAYDFNSGMVTVLAFTNITLKPAAGTVPAVNYALDYSFENLPARAVFSVYGLQTGGTKIQHTNRGLPENGGAVSTFEVLPEPASLALLACGAAGLLRRRRR